MVTKPTLAASLCVLAAPIALAACGGSSDKTAAPPPSSSTPSSSGPVHAEATEGLVGPSASVDNGQQTLFGGKSKMTADLDRPTKGQQNGVGGNTACATAAANPSPANLNSIATSTVCLLNAERSANGLPPLHLNQKLTKASALMAGLMVKQRFFAHDTP